MIGIILYCELVSDMNDAKLGAEGTFLIDNALALASMLTNAMASSTLL